MNTKLRRIHRLWAAAVISLYAGMAWGVDLGFFPCNDLSQVRTLVTVDKSVTEDGNGSLKVEAVQNAQITVADQKHLDVQKGETLWCILKVRCEGVANRAYLEMWCEVAEGKRAFSKGLDQAMQGRSEWREIRLSMMVNGDFTVNRALVNVVIEGPGTVWVDQVTFKKVQGLPGIP
jgi:hypothetical protein